MGASKLKIVGGDGPLRAVPPEEVVKDATLGGVGLDWSIVPSELGDLGVKAWEHLAETFREDPTRFREADRPALESYCTAREVEALAARSLREVGLEVEGRSRDDKRPVRSPAYGMWRDANAQARAWADALGLTPSSRYRMKIPEPVGSGSEDNPFAPGS